MISLMWLRVIGAAGIMAGLYGGYQYIQHTGYAQCKVEWDADTARNVKAQADKTLADAAVTAPQWDAAVWQVREWVKLYGIAKIVRHSDISPGRKIDPGSGFAWGKFLAAVRKGDRT